MSDWRARRDDGARPTSVLAVVRRVHASLRAARAVESVLFFVGGALAARGALLLSAGGPVAPGWTGDGALVVVALCGLLCGLTWWLEHPVGLAATARALDGRLRHDGALATAFELERERAGTLRPMERLVQARVLQRLRASEAVRALLPPLALPVAAPLGGLLVLLLVVDARRAPPEPEVDFRALAGGLQTALSGGVPSPEGSSASSGPRPTRAWLEELGAALAEQRALPADPEAWREDPAGALGEVEALDARLARLAAWLEPGSEQQRSLVAARAYLDALRMALGPEAGAEPAGASEGSGAGPLTDGGSRGTISGSPSPGGAAPAMPADPTNPIPAPAPERRAPDVGLQAGTWWPEGYDAVVRRWLELRPGAEAGGR